MRKLIRKVGEVFAFVGILIVCVSFMTSAEESEKVKNSILRAIDALKREFDVT